MTTRTGLQKFGLRYNPFNPGITGPPTGGARFIPGAWTQELRAQFEEGLQAGTPRTMTVTGPPGAGKTTLLRWMAENLYQPAGIRTHVIINPRLSIFPLADRIMEQAGPIELAKGLWELIKHDVPNTQGNPNLSLVAWIDQMSEERRDLQAIREAKNAILKQGISKSRDVAQMLAISMFIIKDRPYYNFTSLNPGATPHRAPELTESFRTLIRLLQRMQGASGVALLVDDFEDLTLQDSMTRKQVSDHHETLDVLMKMSQSEDLWLVYARNRNKDRSELKKDEEQDDVQNDVLGQNQDQGWARNQFNIPALTVQNAHDLVYQLIREARTPDHPGGLWPFDRNVIRTMNQPDRERPRPLVRTLSRALYIALEKGEDLPVSNGTVWDAQEKISN